MASALAIGVLGVDCVAGIGKIYTWSVEGVAGSGLLVAWVVGFWGSSISSFPLPSSVSIGEVSSFFSHGQTAEPVSEDSKFSINPSCCCYRHYFSTIVSLSHSSSGLSSS